MRRFSVLFLLGFAACKGGGEAPRPAPAEEAATRPPANSLTVRSGNVLRIHPVADLTDGLRDFVPPQITLVGVEEDSDAPLFGVQDHDVEIAQAAAIGDPLVATFRELGIGHPQARGTPFSDSFGYVADRADLRKEFSDKWRGVMEQLERDARARAGVASGAPAAPDRVWQRSGLVPNTSRLRVGDKEELPLRAMRALVRIDGFRARVLLDFVHENTRDRRLEGDFQLRLPDGASPFYLGFSATKPASEPETGVVLAGNATWAAPKEARIVPREKAARAYREVVRRQVDPALLEWSGAGVFRARVFPLEPGKLHRIVVGYDVDLLPAGDDLEFRLDLPGDAKDLRVDVTVAGLDHEIEPPCGNGARHVYDNPEARSFVVRVRKPGDLVLLGRDAAAGDLFAALARPEIDAAPAAPTKRATFLVDLSLSSDPEIWLKLLEAILDRNRGALEEFSVLFFNIEAFWWRDGPVANTPGNVRALLADARNLTREGATDLGLALETAAKGPPGDLFLLSDGAATWGEGDRPALARCIEGRALYAYATGIEGTDAATLSLLARETGGAVFSVALEAEIAAAATAHTVRPWHIEEVAMEGASDLLLAGRPTTIFPGQTLLLAGRGRPPGPLDIRVRRDDVRRTVRIPLRTLDSDLAASAYGRIAVTQLEEAEAPEARAYALHFGVVRATCSLLMLETEEDYARYGIVPAEDARAVRDGGASELVARALAAPRGAKAAFLAWLDRLKAAPGVELELPAEVRAFAERLPPEAFDVRPEPLACVCRDGAPQRAFDLAEAESWWRRETYGPADALRALSSVVEEEPGDETLVRAVGYKAMQWGFGGHAYHLFRRVAEARPYEPGGFHAMASCLADAGKPDLALLFHEIARAGKWDGRFGSLRWILDLEYFRFLGREDFADRDFARARREALKAPQPADLVAVISWNTDGTDIDLHVTDPTGEECFYGHRETAIGGRMSEDVRSGHGPEMFLLERGVKGPYAIRARCYASDRNRVSSTTRVLATIYEDFGRPGERATRMTLALADQGDGADVALVLLQ